jgi:hypothetical protein
MGTLSAMQSNFARNGISIPKLRIKLQMASILLIFNDLLASLHCNP